MYVTYQVLSLQVEVVVVISCPQSSSWSFLSLSAGVRVCGSAQCLHDPHASCAQLWHHQVPLQQAVPGLPENPEGGVPAEHVATLRFRCPKVHDGWEQQLATTADPHTPGPELLTLSGSGWRGHRKRTARLRPMEILWELSPSDFVRTFYPQCGTARVSVSILCPLLWVEEIIQEKISSARMSK